MASDALLSKGMNVGARSLKPKLGVKVKGESVGGHKRLERRTHNL